MAIWPILFPTLCLLSGVADDLRHRKVHNHLVMTLALAGLLSHLSPDGSFLLGLQGFGLAALLFVPLFAAGILGAGDAKLMMVFGLVTSPQAVLLTALNALVWGSLLGIFIVLLRGNPRSFFINLLRFRTDTVNDYRIPFTVALYFGWITAISQVTELSLWSIG